MFLFGNGASSGYFFKNLGIGWFQFVEMSNPSFPPQEFEMKWLDLGLRGFSSSRFSKWVLILQFRVYL